MTRSSMAVAEARSAWLFLAPSLLLFAVFVLLPVLAAFGISFTRWDLFTAPHFAGLQNYKDLIVRDELFHKVLRNTLVYVIGTVPVQMLLALLVALLLNRGVRGQTALRVIYFLPVVSSTVAVALIWSWIYNSNFGVLNALLSQLGVQDLPAWLNSSRYALPALIIVAIWQGLGYSMVLFLAGLQGISREVYEAGAIDGAVGWRKHYHLTLPLLSPTTFFVTIVSLIGSFQVFDLAFVMTQGGPANATNTIVYYVYQNAFQFYRMGYASAAAMILFAIILVLTLLQYRLQHRWVHYE
ncbi:carbohydrate ABC transporter permease [Deinococcus peraridilitoris]|uniref:Permease component of ABC-type sugar transporter n=1 Tax=Deinococcus peraridilitoris (strain DSM 19664 / LMG 22246 / CIP 109416 / KR-200) TaxID=937777 RepID=L0A8C1_DEIPD|nr:sugar ABC transporter permease [Deinococcus peraridilitoris]AFZ69325.1 permease component of ABC-type sugar transporter [Deinococcus peraridilitoris DSM 19664]